MKIIKKLFTITCCLALLVSGMAQPKTVLKSDKYIRNGNLVEINKASYFNKEKPTFTKKRVFPQSWKQNTDTNWWEPDTIYVNFTDSTYFLYSFSYENSVCISNLVQIWDGNQWQNHSMTSYKYDTQNNLTEELFQEWNGEWENFVKYTYTYDGNNNTEGYVLYWESNQWINGYKYLNTFEPNNNIKESIEYVWEGTWVNDWKENYSYNAQNEYEEILYQYWESGMWRNAYKSKYDYDPQNNLKEILGQFCYSGVWFNSYRQVFTYDDKNRLEYYIFQDWDDVWVNDMKILLTYDSRNNITSEIWQSYSIGTWVNVNKSTVVFDTNNNATSGDYQYWDGNKWIEADGHLMVYYNYMKSATYLDGNRFTATYIKTGSIGIKENNLHNYSVTLYPNPTSNILHIEIDNDNIIPEVKIYSLQGILLIKAKGGQIDVSSLQSGIYVAVINGVCKKFVKM